MTTDTELPKEEEKKETDLTDALAAIEKTVSEKLERGLSSIEKKIVKDEPKEDVPDWSHEEGEEDQPVSKKELAEYLARMKREQQETFEAKSKKQIRDAQAMEEFPELNQRSPTFSKKFYEEVSKEITQRVQRGRSAEDADLVYDATAAIAAKGMREGWYSPASAVRRESVRQSARDDRFDVKGTGSSNANEPTEEQVRFASKMGLGKERLTQLLGKTSRSR